ncbi:hypothetical protein OH76DRAFT_1456170 [Lentinus brumalis]|uniref:Queuosine 5'-phosphate N-glycosylase/hydrolase n=1 Tax=Lentinus brumalis TaxID=2498619 RepID=A0A371D7T8_9APHY|nr:hypothetical protein OH76DRAFT_1456170 [Polyporus brumalis]
MTIKIAATSAREPQTDVHSKAEHAVETDGAVARPVYEEGLNPALETSEWVVEAIALALPHEDGIRSAAKYIHAQMQRESYTPRTWRTHPLHICPAEPFSWEDPSTHACLNWIFLISSLNFSFWSELEGLPGRYGVEWREGWDSDRIVVHTGYWSLVAAVNRAIEDGIPITDPAFYADQTRCPDSLITHIFRPAAQSIECIPLLHERIRILREVGSILCSHYGGSFYGFIEAFRRRYDSRGSALQLVKMVADTFPSFRDEHTYNGQRVYIWKRTQILVAETWAAFYPEDSSQPHPLFPAGARIQELTMFADYRVPQILHHLRILSYPPTLVKLLNTRTPLASGSPEELSIRAASIVAVERVRREIIRIIADERRVADGSSDGEDEADGDDTVSSVVIDFYLWDLAKRVEGRPGGVEGVQSAAMLPIHRTRSIWY